jgi:hypothetical protein
MYPSAPSVVPIGGEDDHPHRVVACGAIERGVELAQHLIVLGIHQLGAGEHDPRHTVSGLLVTDVFPRLVHAAESRAAP